MKIKITHIIANSERSHTEYCRHTKLFIYMHFYNDIVVMHDVIALHVIY